MRDVIDEETSGGHGLLKRGRAMGRLQKAPQMATADSFLKLMLWKYVLSVTCKN